MTALSLQNTQPAQFGSRQSAPHLSRNHTASSSSSPSRGASSQPRHSTLAMSHLRAQYSEASAARAEQNGARTSVSPAHPASRHAQPTPTANGTQRSQSPASQRPPSAPGNRQHNHKASPVNGHLTDDDDDDDDAVTTRPAKLPLLRSKSEHGLRHEETVERTNDEEFYEWGARHGFEDHYQSEDIISQLANVSVTSLLSALQHHLQLSRRLLSVAHPSPSSKGLH